jgi:hypothetical protein
MENINLPQMTHYCKTDVSGSVLFHADCLEVLPKLF